MDFLQLESDAYRLRQCLRLAGNSELRLLCCLRFFTKHANLEPGILEPFAREFVPAMAVAAKGCTASDLLPEDVESLVRLDQTLSKHQFENTLSTEMAEIRTLYKEGERQLEAWMGGSSPKGIDKQSLLGCLFVEHYPDLGLEPRGRIVTLQVAGVKIGSGASDDAISVHDPAGTPDDLFLGQARRSVLAARAYLSKQNGISTAGKFKIEYLFGQSAGRFVGDSLGLAFAVGAVTAINHAVVSRELLRPSAQTVFTGALSSDGVVQEIDNEGLRLKIHRAFYSTIARLVVPESQLDEARKYLALLHKEHPRRPLEIIGVRDLASVIGNNSLIVRWRRSYPDYVVRKVRQYGSSPWTAGLLAAFLIMAIALYFYAKSDHQPAQVRSSAHGFEVCNRFGLELWEKGLDATLMPDNEHDVNWKIADLDGDGQTEILYMPQTLGASPVSGWLFVFRTNGDSLFSCDGSIRYQYPNDSTPYGKPIWMEATSIEIMKISGQTRIVTRCCRGIPSRGYIKIWDTKGRQLGWYVHAGAVNRLYPADVDGDGTDEIVGQAFANRVHAQSVFVLRPDSCHGVSPPYWNRAKEGDYDLGWVERGNQMYYVFFPVSDMGRRELRDPYQPGMGILANGPREWVVHSLEHPGTQLPGGDVVYFLNDKFRATGVTLSDSYGKRRQEWLNDGRLVGVDNASYADTLLYHVTYAQGDSLVTEGELRARGE